ncbi:MAG: gluconate 2-dehydrogenase subunit 3 family protein [Thermoguttaceae bacterium]
MSEPRSVPLSESVTPSEPPKITSRRKVLKVVTVAAAGVAIGVGSPAALNRVLFSGRPPRWRFLTDAEASLLDSVCAQIIPTDQDPGAKEAGCVTFIDRQLVGAHQRFAVKYRAGLASLAAMCQALHSKSFEELSSEEQIKLLEKLETGQVPKEHWKIVSSAEFFQLVCDHSMQGFYGSPRHGGNKDYVSYRMLGLAYPNIIGQNRYGGRS